MARTKGKLTKTPLPKDKLLPKLTSFFFDRPKTTALVWLVLAVFGIFSYTTLLRREGFPSVQIPLAIVNGTYFVNDPAKVDNDVANPIADIALTQSTIKKVQSQSADNFFNLTIQYKDGVDAASAAKDLEKAVNESGKLPKDAHAQYNVPYFGATGGDIRQIDIAVSFFNEKNAVSTPELAAKTEEAASWLKSKNLGYVKDVFAKNPIEKLSDPATGREVSVQRTFDRFGKREGNETTFYKSIIIGISAAKNVDVIKLDKQVRDALAELHQQPQFEGYQTDVSASFAPSIKDNLSELQRVLLEGLLAVLVVGSIVIAIRASLITVASMVTVLLISLGFLYLIGYTLNVITLFALILGLALIVDDTIIMVEAIDAARRRHKDRRIVVQEATRKVSRAMVAATLTAALSFAPLLFVGGILGSFIRAIPVTIIASLIISLLVALIIIPFMARFLLLGKKQLGKQGIKEVAAGFEAKLAHFVARPMLWARHSKVKLFCVGTIAILIGSTFIVGGLFIGKNVTFNIFPPTKDTNGLIISMDFPPETTIQQAEAIADKADQLTAEVLGNNFVQASYFGTGSAQNTSLQIEIIPYAKRDITSVQLVKQLQGRFDKDFKDAQVSAGQVDVGPPNAAFTVQIKAEDRAKAFVAAKDLAAYLTQTELKRTNGTIAKVKRVVVSAPNQYLRDNDKPIITVSAIFEDNDTTTLVTLAQDAVKKEFTETRLAQYSLGKDALGFDIGQESENQDSFKTLVLAFPFLLIAMFILLAIQFKSLLQPLLIFMAIPFSLFGIMLGLDLTHNPISFFAMLGFFALVGLSIKNTILLTDFANQARRSGMGPVDAAVAALEERFRPLFATSMTAVVSLIPLAITSPFWQGLAVVLIFGLLSSTLLVVTVFPYYYLGAEYLRLTVSRLGFFAWLVLTGAAVVLVTARTNILLGLLIIPASFTLIILKSFYQRLLIRRASR